MRRWVAHACGIYPSGRKSTATDGERCFVVAKWARHVGMPHARGRGNVASLRLETQGWQSAPVRSRDNTGSRRTKTPTHSRDHVFGQRKCWASSPGAKPTHFPETGATCQDGTSKGKGVKVPTHCSPKAATSVCSRECNIKKR